MVSTNQVRQLYVTKALITGSNAVSALGDVKVIETTDGKVFLQYVGQGGQIASDLINPKHIISAVATKNTELQKKLKQAVLVLDSNVNGGLPVAGEDYIVDVIIRNFIALGDANVYQKFGAVHATANMTASDFYKALAKSLVRNFSRDINKFFKIYLTEDVSDTTDTSTWQEVKVHGDNTPTSAFAGVIISEQSLEADYVRGEFQVDTTHFQVIPHTVVKDGDEVRPFTVETDGEVKLEDNGTVISGAYEIADTEYFCMGERGDIYRQMGYPKTIRTKYMVDTDQEYCMIDIVFYFEGRGISVQHSDKMLTLVVPVGASGSEYTLVNSIISALNTALGTSIATIS